MRTYALASMMLLLTVSACGYEIQYSRESQRLRAQDQEVEVLAGNAQRVTLEASGVDDLSYEILSLPRHGTLSGEAPELSYRPDAGFSGRDEFSFRATAPGAQAASARVVLKVDF
jgi:hypothetical protein